MLAWVESPFQLLGAAELAHSLGRPISVAMRLTGPQMETTAAELLRRGAAFTEVVPYVGIPWSMLSRDRVWAVGDGFSGQFRMAGSTLRPQRTVLLDDGANTLALADALVGRGQWRRPRRAEGRVSRLLGGLVRDQMLGLAARERLELFTAFPLGEAREAALAEHGVALTRHAFAFTRATADPLAVPGDRLLLGSARPADGLMPAGDYVRWVAAEARAAPLSYLPHRRETARMLADVAALPGVRMHATGLPVELVLAGIRRPIELVSLRSSATTTLALLLAGTGSSIRQAQPAGIL